MLCIVALAFNILIQGAIGVEVEDMALDYLAQYGYLQTFEGVRPSAKQEYLGDAIKKFQEFGGLEKTGIIDKETQELMKTPRCGLDDRVAIFVARDRKWEKRV